MRCAAARRGMTRGLREPLPPEQETALTAHLARCAACRREQLDLQGLEGTLLRLGPPDEEKGDVPRWSARQIAAQAQRDRAPSPGVRTALGVGLALAGAAVVLRIVGGWPTGRLERSTGARQLAKSAGAARVIERGPNPHPSPVPPRGAVPGTATAPRTTAGSRTAPELPVPHPPRPVDRTPAAAPVPDSEYLNGADPGLTAQWMAGDAADAPVRGWLTRRLPAVKDDFVSVPLPRLASTDARSPVVKEAVRAYEEEAAVVDTRLFRRVTVEIKAAPLAQVCEELARAAGVRIEASRGVRDEKATVLVKDRPARDVMRAVARLFGYQWTRAGKVGDYRYQLFQDLRSQLAEEEMRSRDLNAALLALDAELRAYLADLDLTPAQLNARLERASGAEKERLRVMLHGGWGIAQVYRNLSPAELATLRNGAELEFSDVSPDANRRLPAEWRPMLVQTSRDKFMNPDTDQWIIPADEPDATVSVSLKINRTELGQLTLEGTTTFDSRSANFQAGIPRRLATGRSPSTAAPDNATVNRALRGAPAFQAPVTLHPEGKCPGLKRWDRPGTAFNSSQPLLGEMRAPPAHLHSEEIWEELYRRTGRPIVADCYTRLYPASSLNVENTKLFDALCQTGDALGVRWRADGDFLLARSTSYFWDKLKEVPDRLVRHWQLDAKTDGGLPLRDLFEMASLSDQQLDSRPIGEVMRRCFGLDEWGVVGGGPEPELRPWARFLSQLPPQHLAAALSPDGLPLDSLLPVQQNDWLRVYHSPPNPGMRLRAEYVPAGRYVWMPTAPEAQASVLGRLPVLSARTVEEGLAAARRHLPGTRPTDFRRSAGVLAVTVYVPGEETMVYRRGKPPALIGPTGGP